jgi:hypothetical protein
VVPWAPCPRTSTLGTPPPPPSYECGFMGVGGSSARRCSRASAPRLLERRRSTAELLPHYRIGGAHHGVVVARVGAGAGAAGGQAGLPLEHLKPGCLPLDLAIPRALSFSGMNKSPPRLQPRAPPPRRPRTDSVSAAVQSWAVALSWVTAPSWAVARRARVGARQFPHKIVPARRCRATIPNGEACTRFPLIAFDWIHD